MKATYRKHRSTGGLNEAADDLNTKNERRNTAPKIENAAEERKCGGRAKRKRGGLVPGEKGPSHAGRKPRKSGGRATSDQNPFTSAYKGTQPKGHKVDMEMDAE